jgi:hypothetical protein
MINLKFPICSNNESTPKSKKMILLLGHQVTKNHKKLISNILFLMQLSVFVAKNGFSEWTQ